MDNDKYRIHMDGDNIYVIYASPSQSSEINQSSHFDSSKIENFDSSKIEIDTSPIIPVISQLQSEHQKSSSYLPQIEYPPYSSILASFPNIQNLPKPSATSSHFLLSSFKTVVQPDSIKTYRAGSEDDSGNYLLNHGLRTPNERINQRNLKFWADVADKICFDRTYNFGIGI